MKLTPSKQAQIESAEATITEHLPHAIKVANAIEELQKIDPENDLLRAILPQPKAQKNQQKGNKL